MSEPTSTTPVPPPPLLQRQYTQNVRLSRGVMLGVLAVGGVALIVGFGYFLTTRQRQATAPKLPAKPSQYEISGQPAPDAALKLQERYDNVDRRPKVVAVEKEPPPATPQAPMWPQTPPTPIATPFAGLPTTQDQGSTPTEAATTGLPTGGLSSTKTSQASQGAGAAGGAKPPPPPKPGPQWFKAQPSYAKVPFADKQAPQALVLADGATRDQASSLLTPAHWVRPKDITRVIYREQVIHGLLLDGLNSDAAGDARIQITRPVYDLYLTKATPLIPQHSVILVGQNGKATYGQNRLLVSVDELRLHPDGSLVELPKGGVGDQDGTPGLKANVNNHYPELFAGAIISALLSFGARSVGGNGDGAFQSSPTLEASRQLSQSLNQTGNEVVKRELSRAPTLTREAGTPVTLRLTKNLVFSANGPKVIK